MPSTIPHHRGLAIGQLLSTEVMSNLLDLAKAQEHVDAAQQVRNSKLAEIRSLVTTRDELRNLGIATRDLDNQIKALESEFSQTRANNLEVSNDEPRDTSVNMQADAESPIDYIRSQIKSMPIATDSVNVDVQYFSLDSYNQGSHTFAAAVSSFVLSSTSEIGKSNSEKLIAAVESQLNALQNSSRLMGTLIVSVSCTHKNAAMLAPFVLQVDKAVKVWNRVFNNNQIDMKNPTATLKKASESSAESRQDILTFVSGTTFGSSLVNMI